MSRNTLRIDDLPSIAIPENPSTAPDGSQVVYVLRQASREPDATTTSLWLASRTGVARRLTEGLSDANPAFSPDGEWIAFERDSGIWLVAPDGGEPRQLTSLPLGAGAPLWSHDSSRIAFLAPVDADEGIDGDDDAHGRRHTKPIVSDGLDYRADGTGYLRAVRTQLHVIDIASGSVQRLTDSAENVTAAAWRPDGKEIAFIAKPVDADDLALRAAVHVVDSTISSAGPRVVAFPNGVAAAVTFTPDGSELIVVGWLSEPRGHAHLYLVDAHGGEPVDLTGSLDRNVMPGAPAYPGVLPQFTTGGEVLFAIRDSGCTHLYAVSLDGAPPRRLLGDDDVVVSGLSVAGNSAIAAIATPTSFGELAWLDPVTGNALSATDHGAWLAEVTLFKRVPRRFTISDGTEVHAWVIRDPELQGPGPLLLDVHGGPHNAWNGAADEMHPYHQELAAMGWTILLVNPRGSDGYGEEFYDAVFGAWGEADARDFLEPIDALVREGIADPARLAITGYSYGGFTTCYLTGIDDRFAAAVAGGVVTDLTSMGGTSDDAHLLNVIELGLQPWRATDRDRLAELSPYTRVERVTTPTLILHGADDLLCPLGQAQQWHAALREREVPTRLVIYPGGSHALPYMGRPSHRMDYAHRLVDWIHDYAGDVRGPRPSRIDSAHWERRLRALASRYGVPGAQLGILRALEGEADDQVVCSTGSLNLSIETGAPVSAASLFQIGSITKVYTATAIMRLVDDGKLDLETRLTDAIPELRLASDEHAEGVTIRHLLTHTSGIDGDVFTDTGRGDDCLERYAELLETAAVNHPLGSTWSYCNSGYSLLGLIIERVTGMTWDSAMAELVFRPLGLAHTVTLAEEALLHATAVGHVEANGVQGVVPQWGLPRSTGPAGLISSCAADVLAFARMHLTGGVAADGSRLLSQASATAMQAFQVDLPDKYVLGDSWGLGWIRFGWDNARLVGHDGNTIGQSAFLRMHPESGLVVTLLTNGGDARGLYQELYRELFAELAGVRMPDPLAPSAHQAHQAHAEVTSYLGTYERESQRCEIFADGGRLRMRTTALGAMAALTAEPVEEYDLQPFADGQYLVKLAHTSIWVPVTFYELPTGESYVHFAARATPKQVEHA